MKNNRYSEKIEDLFGSTFSFALPMNSNQAIFLGKALRREWTVIAIAAVEGEKMAMLAPQMMKYAKHIDPTTEVFVAGRVRIYYSKRKFEVAAPQFKIFAENQNIRIRVD